MDVSYIINELGEDRENYYNAISPPIIQTSNFAFRKFDDLRKGLADEMSDYLYTRGRNPTVDILRKKLAALDGSEDALVFNSGASAIFAAILANVKSGDHVVSVRNPYTWAQRTFDVILPRFKVSTTYIDGRDIDNWKNAIRPNTTLFYLESPNSWDFAIQDLEAIVQLAKSGQSITTIIDNSYCTPLFQDPIGLGIDIAVQTATKYIGGHSDTLGGVLSGSASMIKRIFDSEYLNTGTGIQPFNAWLLIRGLRTLPARLERISRITRELISFIRVQPQVEGILFPLDESFPQFSLAQKQMKGACGLFTMILKTRKLQSIVRFCESLQHVMMAVSWGGHESLVMPKCAGFPESAFDPANIEHRYVRVYVGMEESAYLIEDFRQALSKID